MLEIKSVKFSKNPANTNDKVTITVEITEKSDYQYDYKYDYPISHTHVATPKQ